MSELYNKKGNTDPIILLIISTYNCADTLSRCLEGFISQTYHNKKIVIIDGGSSDGTVDIIRRYQDQVAYWVSEPDQGIYHAWNKALACGEKYDWVQFMGGDDYYYNDDVLKRVSKNITLFYPNHSLAYSNTCLHYPNGSTDIIGEPWDIRKIQHYPTFPSAQICFFYHKAIFEQYGIFDESFRILGDAEHFARFLDHEKPYYMGDIISTVHSIGGISSDPKYDYLNMRERMRLLKMHGYSYIDSPTFVYLLAIRYTKHITYKILGRRGLEFLVKSVRSLSHDRKLSLKPRVKRRR